jgi:hypothetical protein
MAQMMMPLILCCVVVSSSSFAMQFMGGMGGGLGGLFDTSKLTGTMRKAPPGEEGKLCDMLCGDCTQSHYDKMHAEIPEEPKQNWKAICENNKSEFVGNNQHWSKMIHKVGKNCCT